MKLTWGQVDFDGRIIDLQQTKTDPRRVPLTVSALEILSELVYIDLIFRLFFV